MSGPVRPCVERLSVVFSLSADFCCEVILSGPVRLEEEEPCKAGSLVSLPADGCRAALESGPVRYELSIYQLVEKRVQSPV